MTTKIADIISSHVHLEYGSPYIKDDGDWDMDDIIKLRNVLNDELARIASEPIRHEDGTPLSQVEMDELHGFLGWG